MVTVFPEYAVSRPGISIRMPQPRRYFKVHYDIVMIRGTNIALNEPAGKTQECGNEKPRPRYSVELFGERGECPRFRAMGDSESGNTRMVSSADAAGQSFGFMLRRSRRLLE